MEIPSNSVVFNRLNNKLNQIVVIMSKLGTPKWKLHYINPTNLSCNVVNG